MFSTCHPCNYDEKSLKRQERFQQQLKSLFGEVDLKKDLITDNINILNLKANDLDIFQEMGEFKLNNMNLKDSITVISNYIDIHLQKDEEIYEFDDERFVDNEEKRAIEAERKLKDTFAHSQLRKFLRGNITCLDSLKPA